MPGASTGRVDTTPYVVRLAAPVATLASRSVTVAVGCARTRARQATSTDPARLVSLRRSRRSAAVSRRRVRLRRRHGHADRPTAPTRFTPTSTDAAGNIGVGRDITVTVDNTRRRARTSRRLRARRPSVGRPGRSSWHDPDPTHIVHGDAGRPSPAGHRCRAGWTDLQPIPRDRHAHLQSSRRPTARLQRHVGAPSRFRSSRPSATAPQDISATSPTNTVPHLDLAAADARSR